MTRSWTLAVPVLVLLALPASAAGKFTADTKGDQVLTVPCPDGSSAKVTVQPAQLDYEKDSKTPKQMAQYVRVGVFAAPGGCATEMIFEVIAPPKTDDFGDFDHIYCRFSGTCEVEFADDPGPRGGDVIEQDIGSSELPEPYYVAVPPGDGTKPYRLYVPMLPKVTYQTFGKPDARNRPEIVVYVRAKGTTGLGVPASTSVGLWTAGGFAGADGTIPKTISRSALAAGRVKISTLGPEGWHVRIKVHAGKTLVASGTGRLGASGRLKVRLKPRAAIPASARSVKVDVGIEGFGVSGSSRLTR